MSKLSIRGSVLSNDVLVEFTIAGGVGADPCQAIRHHKISHDDVRRMIEWHSKLHKHGD